MTEHKPGSNAEFLERHPNAEPDPDRANTAAYARKKIDDLIEIAKASGQDEVEVSLEKAADVQEQTEVAEYDTMEQGRRDLIENFARGLVELSSGKSATLIKEFDTIENSIVLEGMTKFLEYINAKPIAKFYTNKYSDHLTGMSLVLSNLRESLKECIVDTTEEAVEPAVAWTIYSTAYPDINLIVRNNKAEDWDDFTGCTELTLVTREVTDGLLQDTDSDTSDKT
jgi:hypothetical protein